MKKIILLMAVLWIYSTNGFAQATATIGSAQASVGDTVSVPINVTGFSNVGAVSIKINYDSSVLNFIGTENAPVTFTTNAAGGVISLGWFDATASSPINIASGKLLDLKFVYNGGTSNLTFNTAQSEIADGVGSVIPTTFNDGIVSPSSGPTVTLELANVQDIPGSNIAVALNVQDFNNIGAVSLKINYDPAVLTFNGVSNAPAGVTFSANATGGVISVGWFDNTGTNPISIADGKLIDLDFTYKGGTSALTFDEAQSEISDSVGTPIGNVNYINGSVSPLAGSNLEISIDSVSAVAGNVAVPVNVENFSNVGAVSLKINYDPSVLTFNGVLNAPAGVTFTTNSAGGVISISWFDGTGTNPISIASGKLFDLDFTFNGVNSSDLVFNIGESEIANDAGIPITGVVYSSGGVFVQPGSQPTLTIANVVGTVGSMVSVPINAENLNSIGAISLKINYDETALTFTGVSDEAAGVNFSANASGGVVSLSWFDATATNPVSIADGNLVNLNFTYISGASALTFNTLESELANDLGIPIANVNYINGSVSAGAAPTIEIASVVANPGDTISVPVNVETFNNVGAISLKINYNSTVLNFTGVSDDLANADFSANASGGVISIGWFDASGNSPLNLDSAKLFDLNFIYSGGTSDLTFNTSESEIADGSGTPLNNVVYVNGAVSGPGTKPELTLAHVAASETNSAVAVPLTVNNFDDIGAVSLKIQYNAAVLTFNGLANEIAGADFNANAAGGVITIGWFDPSGNTPLNLEDGSKLFDLDFTYASGTSPLNFITAESEIANSAGQPIAGVIYNNGSVVLNAAPSFTAEMPDDTISEGETLTFQYQAIDPEGQQLTYSLVNPPAGAIIDSATGLFTWTPDFNQSGNYDIVAVVSDGNLTDTSRTAVVVVLESNRLPQFTAVLPDTTIAEGQTLTFTYAAIDEDGEELLFSILPGSPSGSSIDPNTGEFSWTPTFSQAGTRLVIIGVRDPSNVIVRDTAVVTVTNTNREPSFVNTMPDQGPIVVGDTLRFKYTATDPDADALTFALVDPPAGASISTSGDFVFVPQTAETFTIIVSVTDQIATVLDTAMVTVITDIRVEPGIPESYALSQNFPNPFNPTTNIKFNLPSESLVTLKVYNLLGEEVASLVNEVLPAGYYNYDFDASALSSGIYIYRIQAEDFISTKKMTLIK